MNFLVLTFNSKVVQVLAKPILFSIFGLLGGVIAAALIGELFLYVTKLPPSIVEVPQDIVLLIDTSDSMNEDNKLDEVKAAATDFIERQDLSNSQLAIVGFGTEVKVGSTLSSNRLNLRQALDSFSADGATQMSLGIHESIRILEAGSFTPNILLFTDGQPTKPPRNEIDVLFVLDTTGSMDEEIVGIRKGIQDFAQELEARNLDGRIGLLAFRDRFNGEEPTLLNFGSEIFTNNISLFQEKVGRLEAAGGDDIPESSLDALSLAARQPFRPDAEKVILLITDAPPQIPDQDTPSLRFAVEQLQSADIDQLHLVLQQSDLETYKPLQDEFEGSFFQLSESESDRIGFERALPVIGEKIAETKASVEQRRDEENATLIAGQEAKEKEIQIVAVGTGDAKVEFLSQLTGNSELVYKAELGEFDKAFIDANQVIGKTQVIDPEPGDYGLILGPMRVGGWTGLLAIGISLALTIGQNRYLRRRLVTKSELFKTVLGGLTAGIVSGMVGEYLYFGIDNLSEAGIISTLSQSSLVGLYLGWMVLGGLLGIGMSVFVPNLPKRRSLLGGLLGGLGGAFAYSTGVLTFGSISGHIFGAAMLGLFIGLMTALAETMTRKAWLVVEWSQSEQRKILLGDDSVVLGSSDQAHIYLRKDQGFPPVTARISVIDGKIMMQFDEAMRQYKGMKVLNHQLSDGDRRKIGGVVLQVHFPMS